MTRSKHLKRQPSDIGGPAAGMPETPEARRCRNVLSISGTAILVFLVWGIVKFVLLTAFGEKSATQGDPAALENISLPLVGPVSLDAMLVIVMVILGYSLLEFFMRIYVSRCAIAEGRGERRSGLYLVFAKIMLVASLLSLVIPILLVEFMASPDEVLVSSIIDLTSIAMLYDLIKAGTRLRRLGGEET